MFALKSLATVNFFEDDMEFCRKYAKEMLETHEKM